MEEIISSTPCDVDDILCQLETLRHLRGLQKELGKPVFAERFPELAGISDKLSGEITSQNELLKETINRCGRLDDEGWCHRR